jgi:predicted nucleic acid-binding protein
MPATERAFNEVPPDTLYVDTDILIAALFSSEPHFVRCRAFLEFVARIGQTTIYLSSLVWLEFIAPTRP